MVSSMENGCYGRTAESNNLLGKIGSKMVGTPITPEKQKSRSVSVISDSSCDSFDAISDRASESSSDASDYSPLRKSDASSRGSSTKASRGGNAFFASHAVVKRLESFPAFLSKSNTDFAKNPDKFV